MEPTPGKAAPPVATVIDGKEYHLVEVWNDVVDTRHLAAAVAIGAVVSLGAFFGARAVLQGIVETPQLSSAYAMLAGVAGCILSGVISARLFPPKRNVVEVAGDEEWRRQAMQEMADEPGTTLSEDGLSPAVIREMEELGLRDQFREMDRAARAGKA